MIPQNRLSSQVMSAAYLAADAIEPPDELSDFEMGGVALNDPSQGLKAYQWASWYEDGNVMIQRAGEPALELFAAPGMSELSFCFDQNMRPFHAYMQNGQAKFRWFDTVVGNTVVTSLTATDNYPKCTLDSKSAIQTTEGLNDVILAYMRDGSLYYRQQRDRFEVERLLGAVGSFKLLRVGMNAINRLQFLFEAV